jgi:hypothetical protein
LKSVFLSRKEVEENYMKPVPTKGIKIALLANLSLQRQESERLGSLMTQAVRPYDPSGETI